MNFSWFILSNYLKRSIKKKSKLIKLTDRRSVWITVLCLGKKPAKKDTPLPPKPKVPASLAEAVKVSKISASQGDIYFPYNPPPYSWKWRVGVFNIYYAILWSFLFGGGGMFTKKFKLQGNIKAAGKKEKNA